MYRSAIIDWNRDDFGDPREEFNRITFTAHISPHFATGQLMDEWKICIESKLRLEKPKVKTRK